MAAVMNIRIITKSVPHTLRAISVVMFPPAFIMLLITGIVSERVNPAIGILPMFFSAAYSAFLLVHEKKCGCQNAGLTGTPIHLVLDLTLGMGLLLCLILTWVFLPDCWHRGMIMLGTYGSNFMATNFLIHLYFVVEHLNDVVKPGSHYVQSCPQCQYGPFTNIPKAARGYAPLLDSEGRPTPGEDAHDDTAIEGESAV